MLVCHEPTRKKHWGGWEIVCADCAVEMAEEHEGSLTLVRIPTRYSPYPVNILATIA